MAYSGKFRPKNPSKYKGDSSKIIYRSSWECRVMNYLDDHPGVIWWSSEELVIPYRDPVTGKPRRYFPDFIVKIKKSDGSKRTIVIEVKPEYQKIGPKQQKRKTKKYVNEVYTYAVNQAKWKAAEEFCQDRLWEFKVLTEKDLGINK